MVAGRGTAACMAVSIEGTSLCPDGLVYCATNSILRWMQDLISTKATGTRNSSRAACSSHLPEALIHRTSSSFTEVFPEPACTSSGSWPKRAETSIRAWISEWLVPSTVPAPAYADPPQFTRSVSIRNRRQPRRPPQDRHFELRHRLRFE